ncbi:hypothetical protein DFJ73DRAFT_246544 [Zopfochytrium polystomum]|nr:hypothetical protein DFJ73DRAFT_246544 [Zopfochytrium polystomum]
MDRDNNIPKKSNFQVEVTAVSAKTPKAERESSKSGVLILAFEDHGGSSPTPADDGFGDDGDPTLGRIVGLNLGFHGGATGNFPPGDKSDEDVGTLGGTFPGSSWCLPEERGEFELCGRTSPAIGEVGRRDGGSEFGLPILACVEANLGLGPVLAAVGRSREKFTGMIGSVGAKEPDGVLVAGSEVATFGDAGGFARCRAALSGCSASLETGSSSRLFSTEA